MKQVPPYSTENWLELFALSDKDPSSLLGYMDCINRILPELDKITATSKNYDELKTELLNFNNKQREFINDVYDKWFESDDPSKYGLPYMEGPT